MNRVKITITRKVFDTNAAIGIGTLIIFIAMILVAGIAVSVIVQTMNSLQQQAMLTGQETLKDISSGLKVTHISGYYDGSTISQIAIYIETTTGSNDIDLTYAIIKLSNSAKEIILNYTTNSFSNNVSSGLFGTLNSSELTATTYGVMVIRDTDGYCTATNPVINSDDLFVLIINTTKCFSGLSTRTTVFGGIIPEQGISGVISFTTPSAYINTIIELQT